MRRIKLLTTLIACFVLFSGCATVTVLNLNSAYPAKQPDANIDVYFTNYPKCEYIELAIIESGYYIINNHVMNEIKAKAREVGADGLIIMGSTNITDYETTTRERDRKTTTYSTAYSSESTGIKTMAIKYKE